MVLDNVILAALDWELEARGEGEAEIVALGELSEPPLELRARFDGDDNCTPVELVRGLEALSTMKEMLPAEHDDFRGVEELMDERVKLVMRVGMIAVVARRWEWAAGRCSTRRRIAQSK